MQIAGRRTQGLFSQVTYCGGYSGEVPPLPIPNREVKLTHADGTDPPVGRVGSRRSSEALSSARLAGLLCLSCCTAAALQHFPSSVLPAPLRRFGRGPRSQKKFARDPLPPLYSAALVSVSFFPAPKRRSRIFPSVPSLLCSAALLVSVEPFPLRSDASEQGSSLREIRSEPCSSAFLRCAVDYPVSVVFPPARIKLLGGRRLLA